MKINKFHWNSNESSWNFYAAEKRKLKYFQILRLCLRGKWKFLVHVDVEIFFCSRFFTLYTIAICLKIDLKIYLLCVSENLQSRKISSLFRLQCFTSRCWPQTFLQNFSIYYAICKRLRRGKKWPKGTITICRYRVWCFRLFAELSNS